MRGRRVGLVAAAVGLTVAVGVSGVAADPPPRVIDPAATSQWPCPWWGMYGRVMERTFATDCDTGLSPTTAPTLSQRWFFKTPTTVTASPAVVDGVVYVGDWTPIFYALDATTGALLWSTPTPTNLNAPFGPIVSSAAVADVRTPSGLRRFVIFGSGPMLMALDALDGSVAWQLDVANGLAEREETAIESSPVVHDGIVYVGMDTHNKDAEVSGGTLGGLLAVDAAMGELLWKFQPDHLDQSGCGGVWSSPTINELDGLVYLATANCPIDGYEWGPSIEAVTALDLRDGTFRWAFQPEPGNRDDTDFGATANLFEVGGQRLLGIGKKNAVYYALDPATGEGLWSTQVTVPGNVQEDFAVGGFIGSTAVGGGRIFGGTAISLSPDELPPTSPLYFHALDATTGDIAWQAVQGPVYAASAYTNGVVLNGGLDAVLHVYDAESGLPLNAVPLVGLSPGDAPLPLGGPISSGPAVVEDWVFIGSGTSSSDLCAKDAPGSEICFELFDSVLGGLGGVHGLAIAGARALPEGNPPGTIEPEPVEESVDDADVPATPTTGGGAVLLALAALTGALTVDVSRRGGRPAR